MSPRYAFPNPRYADEDGVVSAGGQFNAKRLLAAYRQGIFPWSGVPVRWYSPDPRSIFWAVRLPKRLGKVIRKNRFKVTFDQAFERVVQNCADIHRSEGEWITEEFVKGYTTFHELGYAHSVEVWQDGELVGGLYGVHIDGLFAGESMFYRKPNASKVAFAALVYHLRALGVVLFDCQVINENTYRFGAALVHREDYLRMLEVALEVNTDFSGVKWPKYGAANLLDTPLKDAVDSERFIEHYDVALKERKYIEEPPIRFWGLENELEKL